MRGFFLLKKRPDNIKDFTIILDELFQFFNFCLKRFQLIFIQRKLISEMKVYSVHIASIVPYSCFAPNVLATSAIGKSIFCGFFLVSSEKKRRKSYEKCGPTPPLPSKQHKLAE